MDAKFYDKGLDGTGSHNDNWTKSSASFDFNRGESYTTFENDLGTTIWVKPYNNQGISGDFCIEWDNYGTSNTNNYFVLGGTSDTAKAFGNSNLQINGETHVKITVTGTTVTCSVGGSSRNSYEINRSNDGKVFTRLQINTNGSPIKFKDFKIYPI